NNIKGQTSLQEISHTTQYVYPNPCKSHIGISIDDAYMISIYTLLGQELMQIEVSDSTNIDISTLPAGMYIVQINTLNQVLYQLITKQ
ncbi:MAG TPA: T9SS type A sorting domain-containing protein, partial [Bacteroidales bacterium]|nr:T9SS type A sorting domain-containing protein [Bacteroidales bacterium]